MIRSSVLTTLVLLSACQPRAHVASAPNSAPARAKVSTAPAVKVGTEPGPTKVGTDPGHAGDGVPLVASPGHELAAFAEGCFWGSEDTFRHVAGVTATAVGYTGGHTAHPTYDDVCSHETGHAETVLVEFDPAKVSYAQLLRVFWDSHDPTCLNYQGPDYGDQYRSAIFTFSPDQERQARASMAEEQKHQTEEIATVIQPISLFYKAESYHQQYDEKKGIRSCPLPIHVQEG